MAKENPLQEYNQALGLHRLGKLDEALLKYKKVARLKPDYLEAHARIADILIVQNKFDEVELRYKRMLSLKPGLADVHYNLGMALDKLGKRDEAVTHYQKAIDLKSKYTFLAMSNIGVILSKQEKLEEAETMFIRALELSPDSQSANYNLAVHFKKRGEFKKALSQYIRLILLKPDSVEAQHGLRDIIINLPSEDYNEVIGLLREYPKPPIFSETILLLHSICAWGKIGDQEKRLLDMVHENQPEICPFILLRTDATASDLLHCAKVFNSKKIPAPHKYGYPVKKSGERINLAYISNDFHEHATAHLMAELFERHDRSRFKVIAYSYGEDDHSQMRRRLEKAFDEFIDIQALSDAEAASEINTGEIDILVDLKGGATGGVRMEILARRAAPVQVNYLGYPGTTGADYIDYIIADPFIIQKDDDKYYSEKVVRLPDCYQPNDRQREADATPTRLSCGLPEKGLVFCCFNANYKITASIFDVWMRLLKAIPGSVLWLLESNIVARKNLIREAENRGIGSERLIFAPKVSASANLARQPLADLFLDTLPVNAHTTASDALWMGLPLLTCAGSTFASRVAGSLLTAANMPELVTYSLEEYEAKALALAQDPTRLVALSQKLKQTRLQIPLFDIEKFTKNLEKAYQKMWDLHLAGKKPEAIAI